MPFLVVPSNMPCCRALCSSLAAPPPQVLRWLPPLPWSAMGIQGLLPPLKGCSRAINVSEYRNKKVGVGPGPRNAKDATKAMACYLF